MAGKTTKQVLLVQNDDQERGNLAAKLKILGHESVGTWSGSEAMKLLNAKAFDFLLVDDYLADMYIGEFLERVSELSRVPKIWVMQEMPLEAVSTYGARSYPVVAKHHLENLFEEWSDGKGASATASEPNKWKH